MNIVLACLIALAATAGSAATIRGRVLSASGSAPIANASIVVVGTTLVTLSGPDGGFSISGIGVGEYRIRAFTPGAKPREATVRIDSASHIVETVLFLRQEGRALVEGCIPEFNEYQANLSRLLKSDPSLVSVSIDEFRVRDSSQHPSVLVTVVNKTGEDIYVVRDYNCGGQIYVAQLRDSTGRLVQPNVRPCAEKVSAGFLHEMSDLRRVPQHSSVVVDTVTLWTFDASTLPVGQYKLRLAYVFPKSRQSPDDAPQGMTSPVQDDQSIGEVYCLVLRGRFESNWLPVTGHGAK